MERLGWKARTLFETGIRKTVEWYKQNAGWWKPVIDEGQVDFHKKF
jgi:dTDP-glucose 4,6-dehydratase